MVSLETECAFRGGKHAVLHLAREVSKNYADGKLDYPLLVKAVLSQKTEGTEGLYYAFKCLIIASYGKAVKEKSIEFEKKVFAKLIEGTKCESAFNDTHALCARVVSSFKLKGFKVSITAVLVNLVLHSNPAFGFRYYPNRELENAAHLCMSDPSVGRYFEPLQMRTHSGQA